MSHSYRVGNGLKVKKEGKYPWPYYKDQNRTILLFTDDVLTKDPNGTYTKHTGICCFNISRNRIIASEAASLPKVWLKYFRT